MPVSKTKHDGYSNNFSLSNRILETLDPCVVKTKEWIENYSYLWQEKGGIFSLAQGVVYWNPPPSCRQSLKDAVLQMEDDHTDPLSLHSYSPARGLPELIKALESKIEKEHGMTNHDVTVTVGANQAYTNIVLTLLGNDPQSNKAVVFAPYYFNHVMAIQMCTGSDAVVVGPTDMNTGVPDIDWLKDALIENAIVHNGEISGNRIRLVTLVNPGNPTGVALSRSKVQEIVDLCREYEVWVVLDCTYEHFFNIGTEGLDKTKYEENPLPTFPEEPHVIHIFSFSKGYALAGYRCGYFVSHKQDASSFAVDTTKNNTSGQFLKQMLKVQDTIPIGPPRLSQHIALGALKQGRQHSSEEDYSIHSKEWVYEKYDSLQASRAYILEALSSLPRHLGGTGSMYVMGKLPDHLDLPCGEHGDEKEPVDVVFCRRLVKEYGIAIIPGSFCGKPGWIRICYANLRPEQTKIAAERLQLGIENLTRT